MPPIDITDLTSLDPTTVQQAQAEITELISELHPELALQRGPVWDLLFYNEGILAARNEAEQLALTASMSLQQVQADPASADDTTVDALLSNLLLLRQTGSPAEGTLTLVVNQLAPVTIALGATFIANGQSFDTLTVVQAKTSQAAVSAATDVLLNPVGDGTYYFSFPVTAVANGVAGNIRKNTLVVPSTLPTNYITSYAAADFTGGADPQTNAELVEPANIANGITAKALSGRGNMSTLLRDQANFSQVVEDSIIGLGDPEMLRNKHSIFPGAIGNQCDWYIRTQPDAALVGLTKTATLVSINSDGYGVWQFGITRDDLPGFYDVPVIVPHGSTAQGTLPILMDLRGVDLTALDSGSFIPDILNATEGAYSRFSTAVIQFTDTTQVLNGLSTGATADYDITLRGFPLLDEIQDFAGARGTEPPAADTLVKAPIPCFVQVSFTLNLLPGQTAPATSDVQAAVANAVNSVGFTGRLYAASIVAAIQSLLPAGASVDPLDMLGLLRRPDGFVRFYRDGLLLLIIDEPQYMVSSRTVAFLTSPADVAVSVQTLAVAAV